MLITLLLMGASGYVGYRLGKGGTEFKMNPAELPAHVQEALRKYARKDLAAAKKEGEIYIGKTKAGTVALRYKGNDMYEIVTQGIFSKVISSGCATHTRDVLTSLYEVEFA